VLVVHKQLCLLEWVMTKPKGIDEAERWTAGMLFELPLITYTIFVAP